MQTSAFPQCYLDDICVHKTMTVFDWIEKSKPLGAEGLEMYGGFLNRWTSLTEWREAFARMEVGDNIKSVIRI